ncbi:hypothetical protein BT96DRAFT_999516 [Gymnopus androsaceus JB14]|uniref:Uncharacterized protein n=1 Tax=Gymnopus androsaceus JB14 TaxID=1447944 RepID=A0A6A4H7M8_9AGAR|nr:hypothetical protein BT96DRAFT_999516 [Gymnopus androsaceus JB14]
MPPKRPSSPSDASPRKKTKRSPSPNPSPSSPSSHRPTTVEPLMSEQRIPIVVSPLHPVSWQTATSAEIDESLKAVFQLGGHSFDIDVTDLEWREVAKRLNCCACCEGKGEMCSAASGTELVRFGALLSWAQQQFESCMARLNSRSYNSYNQPPSFFTSLEEAIQHIARPNDPLSPSTNRVGPPGRRPTGAQAPSVPLRVGDTIIPPGSDLARELEAFEATEAQNAAASKARFFKDQEDARLAAAETKRRLELEQQRKGKRAVKANWEEDLQEQEWKEGTLSQKRPVPTIPVVFPGGQGLPPTSSPPPRKVPSPPPAAAPTTAPSPASPSVLLSTLPRFPPWLSRLSRLLLERPGLDGAAYSRAHLDIASGHDPAMTDLRDAYGDSQRLNPIHPPPMPILRTNNVGALQQELSDMQRRLNSTQLDLETERWNMNCLRGRLGLWRTVLQPPAASAAQAKAYKALVVPGYPVEIGNTSQLIHDLLGTCEHLRQRARSAEDSASSLRESNLDLVAQLGGSYSLEVASENNALLCAESARPASFLAEVARRVEFLVQEICSSLLHGRADPEAYDHAEEASEHLRLHLRVAPLLDQYSTVDPAALLSLAEYAGLVVPPHHHTQRPLYPILPFDTSQPLGCPPPSDSLRHTFFLPLLSHMLSDARDLLRAQLQTCIEDEEYWESRVAALLHLEGQLAGCPSTSYSCQSRCAPVFTG